MEIPEWRLDGSSPLTRGKRYQPEQVAEFKGLIPAHAGKTGVFAGLRCH